MSEDKLEIPAWLPLFPGFYNTIFDWEMSYGDNEDLWRYFEDAGYPDCAEVKEAGLSVDFLFEYDYKGWCRDVVEQATKYVEERLMEVMPDALVELKYDGIQSPREYNFRNDVGECTYVVKPEKLTKFVRKYLKDNEDMWETYLKNNFKSYDGFCSFHSYKKEDWVDETANYTKWSDTTKAGAVFDFIIKNEQLKNGKDACDYEGMYYYIEFPCMEWTSKLPEFDELDEDVQEFVRQRFKDLDDVGRQVVAYQDWWVKHHPGEPMPHGHMTRDMVQSKIKQEVTKALYTWRDKGLLTEEVRQFIEVKERLAL